jgi:hypothetical protein
LLCFIYFYSGLIVQMLILQWQNVNFTALYYMLVMPTIDFRFINVSFPMMVTVTFSMSLGISRIASMCFKGCSSVGKNSRKVLKNAVSQRHMLKEAEGKTNIKKAGSEAAQDVATEKAKEKLIKEADRRLQEAEEAREAEETSTAGNSKSEKKKKNSTKVVPATKEDAGKKMTTRQASSRRFEI